MQGSFILLLKFLIGETKIIIVKYENVHINNKCHPYSLSQKKRANEKNYEVKNNFPFYCCKCLKMSRSIISM